MNLLLKCNNKMEKSLGASIRHTTDVDNSTLTFNLGPSFLQLICNKYSGPSFKYFYDINNSIGSFQNGNDLTHFIECSNDVKISVLNTEKRSIVKVNVFKEESSFKYYLTETFQLFGKEPAELKNELFQVLSSECCISWSEKWINTVMEQMIIFFCCIENGKIYEKLLESASICLKILSAPKLNNMDLLEFKYSYIYFHEKFRASVALSNCRSEDRKTYEGKQVIFNFDSSSSTIEVDLIDGFCIMSFETEQELNEYSNFESNTSMNHPLPSLPYNNTNLTANKEKHGNSASSKINKKEKQNYYMKKLKVSSELVNEVNANVELNKVSDASVQNKSKRKFTAIFESELQENHSQLIDNLALSSSTTEAVELKTTQEVADKVHQHFEEQKERKVLHLPIIHGCERGNNNFQICTCNNFSLGMLLHIGKGRALSKEAHENLTMLDRTDDSRISFRMAAIAACAVWKHGCSSRVVVPVVSKSVVTAIQEMGYDLSQQSIAQNIFSINPEVERVLNDLLDSLCEMEQIQTNEVSLSEMPKTIRKKPGRKKKPKILRELHKLSASLIDKSALLELVKTHKHCANDICENDCECENGLRFMMDIPSNRRGRKSGMARNMSVNRNYSEQNDVNLVEEVTSKHETVISMTDGKNINITSLTDKSKREKRLSSRFKNSVLLDEASLPAALSSFPAMRPRKNKRFEQVANKNNTKNVSNEQLNPRNNNTMSRRFDFCIGTRKDKKTLADVFIWCANHDKFNCLCPSWVIRMKENVLIWRPSKLIKCTTNKIMSRIEIQQRNAYQVYFYDPQDFSARTYGSPINYTKRNRSNIFLAKRKVEQQNGVLSSTNCFIKKKFLIFKHLDVDEQIKNHIENGNIDVFKSVSKENLIIIPEEDGEASEEISVCSAMPILDVSDKISVPGEGEEIISTPVVRRELDGAVKTYLNTKKKHDIKEMIEQSIKVSKGIQTDELEVPETVNDTGSTKTVNQPVEPSQSVQVESTPSSYLEVLETAKFDPNLEHDVIKLENHPLKDEIYGQDNLPKLSLLCVTPGVGYIPIVQSTTETLVVVDPIYPGMLHSFKNISSANLWLNNFFKEYLTHDKKSDLLKLKWVMVKPGIIKLKQSQPFSPAILESSSVKVTENGELEFCNNDQFISKRKTFTKEENKRKFWQYSPECVVDIEGNDGKRKKVHLETEVFTENISKKFVKFPQCFSRKNNSTSSLLRNPSSLLASRAELPSTAGNPQIYYDSSTSNKPHGGAYTSRQYDVIPSKVDSLQNNNTNNISSSKCRITTSNEENKLLYSRCNGPTYRWENNLNIND